jgi:hypothetical protein
MLVVGVASGGELSAPTGIDAVSREKRGTHRGENAIMRLRINSPLVVCRRK